MVCKNMVQYPHSAIEISFSFASIFSLRPRLKYRAHCLFFMWGNSGRALKLQLISIRCRRKECKEVHLYSILCFQVTLFNEAQIHSCLQYLDRVIWKIIRPRRWLVLYEPVDTLYTPLVFYLNILHSAHRVLKCFIRTSELTGSISFHSNKLFVFTKNTAWLQICKSESLCM